MSSQHDRRADVSSAAGLDDLRRRLGAVLVDLEFPARRWQVLTAADLYGVDTPTRGLLEVLPERRYHSLAEVGAVIAAVLAGRPVAAVPGAPAQRPAPPARPAMASRPVPVAHRAVPPPARRAVPRTPVA